MASFQSKKPDLVVSTENGFIQFKNSKYTTTIKKEIDSLKKAIDVEQIGGAKIVPPIEQIVEPI